LCEKHRKICFIKLNLLKTNKSKTTYYLKLTLSNLNKGDLNMVFDDNESWDDHTILTWDYEGGGVIYFSNKAKGKYHVDITWLSEDLLYKDIPMTFHVNIEGVMDDKHFIVWNYNGVNVKYLPCAFDSVHVLDVMNMHEDFLYNDILGELHVYNTHDYFSTIWS